MSESAASGGLTELQRENAVLQTQVTELQIRLMELLREGDDQVTSATIQESYERLCRNIDYCIDDIFEDEEPNFQGAWNRVMKLPSAEREKKMKYMGLLTGESDTLRDWEDKRTTWLCQQRFFNCLAVTLAVWRFLETKIFDQPFPIGTFSDQTEKGGEFLLQDVFGVMVQKEDSQGACDSLSPIRSLPPLAWPVLTVMDRYAWEGSQMEIRCFDDYCVNRVFQGTKRPSNGLAQRSTPAGHRLLGRAFSVDEAPATRECFTESNRATRIHEVFQNRLCQDRG